MTAPVKTRLAEGLTGYDRLLPCGTDSSRRRHLAKAEACPICGTDGRQPRTANRP